ncbi:MAG: metallophosphoesterase [Devosia indica]
MKIWAISDLHTEVAPWSPTDIPDADICVLAGDIARGAQEAVQWAAAYVRPHMPVIGVLGNHEFYGHWIEREQSAAQYHGWRHDVQMLDDMTWTVGDVRFVGATLWTDYDLYGRPDEAMKAARAGMNDHRLIGIERRRFVPADALQLHKQSVAYLDATLSEPFDGETVVVTHHCPHPGSVHSVYAGDPVTPAFCSDLSELIERHQPALWLHGHTHSSFDYEAGNTRIVCNPRGYPGENRDFDPALVVEIGGYDPKPRM